VHSKSAANDWEGQQAGCGTLEPRPKYADEVGMSGDRIREMEGVRPTRCRAGPVWTPAEASRQEMLLACGILQAMRGSGAGSLHPPARDAGTQTLHPRPSVASGQAASLTS
jgi:hypothetical protein